MPASTAYGFHEGSRSEYLAQYVFASWGTAVAIPHQEDHGIDLSCTLMERVGRRFLAKWPYTVQVKSGPEPLDFEGEDAVRWFVNHPLPFYLCVVDKSSARLRVYHTFPRFLVWSGGSIPPRLRLVPVLDSEGAGSCMGGIGTDMHFLHPILDFTLSQMLDDDFWAKARRVFEQWITIEHDNLTRIRTGLMKCLVPFQYETNEQVVEFGAAVRNLPRGNLSLTPT